MQLEIVSTGRRAYCSHGHYDIIINNELKYENIVCNRDIKRTNHVMQNKYLIQAVIDRLHLQDYGLQSNSITCVTTII